MPCPFFYEMDTMVPCHVPSGLGESDRGRTQPN